MHGLCITMHEIYVHIIYFNMIFQVDHRIYSEFLHNMECRPLKLHITSNGNRSIVQIIIQGPDTCGSLMKSPENSSDPDPEHLLVASPW